MKKFPVSLVWSDFIENQSNHLGRSNGNVNQILFILLYGVRTNLSFITYPESFSILHSVKNLEVLDTVHLLSSCRSKKRIKYKTTNYT